MPQTPTSSKNRSFLASVMPQIDDPEADQAWRDAGDALEKVLSELSPEERVFLKMRVLHGCTVKEIARAFHFDPPPFRRRFRNLLETLSRRIGAVPRKLD